MRRRRRGRQPSQRPCRGRRGSWVSLVLLVSRRSLSGVVWLWSSRVLSLAQTTTQLVVAVAVAAAAVSTGPTRGAGPRRGAWRVEWPDCPSGRAAACDRQLGWGLFEAQVGGVGGVDDGESCVELSSPGSRASLTHTHSSGRGVVVLFSVIGRV